MPSNGITHGETKTLLHRVWGSIIQRCTNPKDKKYFLYGGRGITVCPEWRESYQAFRDWALANGYREGLEIDREKNHLGYSPDNCRLVTHQQNVANKRSRSGSSSKYKGVSLSGSKWNAELRSGTDRYYLGRFSDETDAARAYDAKAWEIHGEFACLNFPLPPKPTSA